MPVCTHTARASGLSAGAIVGIVIAAAAALAVLAYATAKLADNRKKIARYRSLSVQARIGPF